MSMNYTTTERLIHLIDKDAVVSQACAAGLLGVSRERVRQIVNKEGLTLGRRLQKNTLIEWDCPRCGGPVKMWTKYRQKERTGLCTPCAVGRPRLEICGRGHDMAETRAYKPTGRTYCGECNRENAKTYYWRKKAAQVT